MHFFQTIISQIFNDDILSDWITPYVIRPVNHDDIVGLMKIKYYYLNQEMQYLGSRE